MPSATGCPGCLALEGGRSPVQTCAQGHRWVAAPLAVSAQQPVVDALWLAVQSLDDLSSQLAWDAGSPTPAQQDRAAGVRRAADVLRYEARDAQRALDASRHAAPLRLVSAGGAEQEPTPRARWVPSHLQVLPDGTTGIALRCTVCGEACPVPDGTSTVDAVTPFLAHHPSHDGGCPAW